MNRVLLIILTLPIFIFLWGFQDERYLSQTVHERLKNSINRGAHDASLQIDPQQLKRGNIVFLQSESFRVFKSTLIENLGLELNLSPKPKTLLSSPVEILFEDYVDDSSGVSFPYSYENDEFKIKKMMKGPAVVYVIRTKMPRVNTLSYDGYVYKRVIFEYPYPR